MSSTTRLSEIAKVGIFSALALAGAYLLISIPNVEIFTAIIFLSGVLFGVRIGVLVGGISAALFGIINPYGISPLPLLVAQILARMAVGLTGGLLRTRRLHLRPGLLRAVTFGLAGFLLTWLYLVLATLSDIFTSGFSLEQLKMSFAFGMASSLLLSVVNAAIFALALPFIIDSLSKTVYFQYTHRDQ